MTTDDRTKQISRRETLTLLGATSVMALTGCRWIDSQTSSGKSDFDDEDRQRTMKTIGVIGGLGPQATMDFEARVHQVSQRLIPPRQNSGYPPMVVYYHRRPPILLNEDSSPHIPIQPDGQLLEAARRLGRMVDFLVITSNGAHMVQEAIERAAGCEVLSMIEVTLEAVRQRRWRRVGVLGFGDPLVYTERLRRLGITFETLEPDLRAKLDGAVMKVMEGRNDSVSMEAAQEAVATLRGKSVDGIILGCTEIPILLREEANDSDLVNPALLLAEVTVRHALPQRA